MNYGTFLNSGLLEDLEWPVGVGGGGRRPCGTLQKTNMKRIVVREGSHVRCDVCLAKCKDSTIGVGGL